MFAFFNPGVQRDCPHIFGNDQITPPAFRVGKQPPQPFQTQVPENFWRPFYQARNHIKATAHTHAHSTAQCFPMRVEPLFLIRHAQRRKEHIRLGVAYCGKDGLFPVTEIAVITAGEDQAGIPFPVIFFQPVLPRRVSHPKGKCASRILPHVGRSDAKDRSR